MKKSKHLTEEIIQKRTPVWMALSELYLDTKLQESDYANIARELKNSGLEWKEIERINREEVFPVLYTNLMGLGEWAGFDKEWLVEKIKRLLVSRKKYFIVTKWLYEYLNPITNLHSAWMKNGTK